MENILKKLLYGCTALLFFSTLASCVVSETALQVLQGNYRFTLGQYQDAMVMYLSSRTIESPQSEYTWYNLANVYYLLGAHDEALRLWDAALQRCTNPDLRFSILFNKGVVYSDRGLFIEALEMFTEALLIKPRDLSTRMNLELSYKNSRNRQSGKASEVKKSTQETMPDALLRLLEYVKRKEVEPWNRRNTVTTEPIRSGDW